MASATRDDAAGRTFAAPPWPPWEALKAFSFRNLVVAVALGALAAGSAAAIAMKQTAIYSSTASMLIDQPSAVFRAPDEGPLRKLSFLRVKYADLAHTPGIAGAAAAGLGTSESEVASSTTVIVTADPLTLAVIGRARTRTRAQELANALASSISNYADQEQQGLGVPVEDRYRLSVVQPAAIASATRIQPTVRHALRAAALLGAFSLVLAFVILQLLTADRGLS